VLLHLTSQALQLLLYDVSTSLASSEQLLKATCCLSYLAGTADNVAAALALEERLLKVMLLLLLLQLAVGVGD
jgi:hypothetical protein